MKLLKGAILDIPEKNAPANSWRYAVNMVLRGGVLQTEQGVELKTSFLDLLPIGDCLLPDNSILFFCTDSAGTDKVYRWKDTTLSIVTSFTYGFNKNYPIVAEAKYTNDLDIEVVFSDNFKVPRLFTIDKDNGTIQEDELVDTLLFPNIKVPNFELQEVGGGGVFDKGSYQITISYKFLDGGYTNWVGISNSIVINNKGGSFRVKITNVDENFEYFKVGILANNDGVLSAERTFNEFNIQGDEKIVSIIGGGVGIPIDDLLIQSLTYDRIGDFAVIDGSLYAGNLSRNVEFSYQEFANNILIEPTPGPLIPYDVPQNSYSDPLVIYDKKGFPNDEIMAFYIGFRGKDGLPIAAFHVPMTQGASTMDLHVNQNEFYPTDKGYPETGGVPHNVRHHKFPRADADVFLTTPSDGDILTTETNGYSLELDYDGNGNHRVKYTTTVGAYGTWSNDYEHPAITNAMWTSGEETEIDVRVEWILNVLSGTDGIVLLQVDVIDAGDGYVDTIISSEAEYDAASTLIDMGASGTGNLRATDRLRIEMVVFPGNPADTFAVNGAQMFLSEVASGFLAGAKYYTRPNFIKLSNIIIPQGILDKVQSFEILYAKRSSANSSILGQSIVYPKVWSSDLIGDRSRFHDFGVILDKPNIYPNKLKGQYELAETDTTQRYTYLGSTPTLSTVDIPIVSSKYIPHNNPAAGNAYGEEHFQINPDALFTPAGGRRLLANIVNERDDYYLSFDTQILVSTGTQFLIPTDTINPPAGWVWNNNQWEVDIASLGGGDTYTLINKVRLTYERKDDFKTDITSQLSSIKTAEIPVQTRYNSLLRTWTDIWYEKEPNFDVPIQVQVAAGYHYTVNPDYSINESTALSYDQSKEYTTYHALDRGYLNENDKVQYNIQADELDEYPHRIIRTPEQNKESEVSSWRQYKPNDYYELNKDRGEIVNLSTIDTDKLIVHHERGLFITSGKEKLATNVTEIIIGSGDIFDRAPKEPIYSKEGYLGTSHKFFNRTTPLGYVFESDNRIFVLGKQLEEITKKGVRFHFNDLLEGVGDNPYIQDETDPAFVGGMSVSYDKLFERLLISVNKINSSETWSYSKDIGAWIGKHSETNNKFIDTSDDVFAIANKQLFIHNAANICKGYDAVAKEAYLVVSFSQPEDLSKLHSNVMWNTTVEDATVYPDRTFTKIRAWDSRVDTGEVDLVNHSTSLVDQGLPGFPDLITERNPHNMRRTHNIWRFNRLRLVADDYADRKKFIDDYLTVKLTYDTTDQLKLTVSDIEVTKRLTII